MDAAPPPARSWSVDLAGFAWSQALWTSALRRLPAIAICLGLALWLRQPAAGAVGAGACLSVGLAGLRQIRGSRLVTMAWTVAAMAVAALVGTLAGNVPWLCPAVTALAAFVFALLTIYDDNVGWVAMQGVIALVIATAFPSHGLAATERAAAIVAGGTVQIAVLSLIWRLRGVSRHGDEKEGDGKPGPLHGYAHHWGEFLRASSLASVGFPYAVRVALTMVAASEAARHLPIQNGYWLPMTTLIVLKPDFYRTYSGGVQRVAGTLAGVGLASALALLRPEAWVLAGLVAAFAFLAFALLKVNSTAFAAVLTAYVVFLIATTGVPEASVTGHRLLNTVLGCALASASRFIGYRHLRRLLGGE